MEHIPEEEMLKERFVTEKPAFIYEWLVSNGVPERHIVFDFGNYDIKNQLIESGLVLGFSSVPFRSRYNYDENIRFVKMDPPILFDMNLYISKEKMKSKTILKEFADFLKEVFPREGAKKTSV